jgi:hypothetical protein
MGGIFNLVNLHVYHYAGNNPVKYLDPDGEVFFIPLVVIGVTVAICITSDVARSSHDTMSVGRSLDIDSRLNNTFYADGGPRSPRFTNQNSREIYGSISLDSDPGTRLSSSMPRGGLEPRDYDDGRTSARGTVMGAIDIGGSTLANYLSTSDSGGHYADVKLNYVKGSDGKMLEWNIRTTGIDPKGTAPKDRILSKSEAMMYLHENRDRLIKDGTYKQIENLFN